MSACPNCNSQKVIEGVVPGAEGQAIDGFQQMLMSRVRLLDSAQFRACADCGLVWSRVDPEELKEFIKAYGKPSLKGVVDGG